MRGAPLPAAKFRDRRVTARGEPRARVAFDALRTLWFNTGTLCNLACANCYIESTPRNDALAYLTAAEVADYLDALAQVAAGPHEIGFTGGEPFLNRELVAMAQDALERGHSVLVLTNAMTPLRLHEREVADLAARHGPRLTLRVSLDHYTQAVHDAERGGGAFPVALAGLRWLGEAGVRTTVAGRHLKGEDEAQARAGYAALFAAEGLALSTAPADLLLFPEMDAGADVAEITDACWGVLGLDPASVMCASSRMVVKRRGAARAHGGGLHPHALRRRLRPGGGLGGGPGRGGAEPPQLRALLRAGRRQLQRRMTAPPSPAVAAWRRFGPDLAARLGAEGIGSFLLFATVVGSGIMAQRLSAGNDAVALLGNTAATGAMLFVLITMLGPISGAHMNPAVTLVAASRGDLAWGDAAPTRPCRSAPACWACGRRT